jgi:hypothetical protein
LRFTSVYFIIHLLFSKKNYENNKIILLGLIIISTLISCVDSCEQKASDKFWQEKAKIDKLKTGINFIKGTYDTKMYDDVRIFAEYYFDDYTAKRLILKMTDEQIKSSKDDVIEMGKVLLKSAEFELEQKKENFIKVCKQ